MNQVIESIIDYLNSYSADDIIAAYWAQTNPVDELAMPVTVDE